MVYRISASELESLKIKVKEAFPEKVSMQELVDCVVNCMSLAGSIKKLYGAEKKDLVIILVMHAMEITSEENDFMKTMEPVIKLIVPRIIDNLIATENGELTFNPKVKKWFVGRFGCCDGSA
jgi:hypothetical protein